METKDVSILGLADPALQSTGSTEPDASFLEESSPAPDASQASTAPRGAPEATPVHLRLQAMMLAARYHGMELNPAEFPRPPGEEAPAAAALSQWAHHAGMWSCACAGATCCGSRMGRRWSCCSATAVPHF